MSHNQPLLVFALAALVGCSSEEPLDTDTPPASSSDGSVRDSSSLDGSSVTTMDASDEERALDAAGEAGFQDASPVEAGGFDSSPSCVPFPEQCNHLDDDCDGVVDNGVPKNACGGCTTLTTSLGTPCSVGIGSCRAQGVYVCAGTELSVCGAAPEAALEETCDQRDNDCDGAVDEDVEPRNVCGGCTHLLRAVDSVCDNGYLGACKRVGTVKCLGSESTWCNAPLVGPRPESCNAVDDDCDGTTDEGLPRGPCGTCNDPPDIGQLTTLGGAPWIERFACCYKDYDKTFGGDCDPGYAYDSTRVTRTSGGGLCYFVKKGNGCRSVVHFENQGIEGAVCAIEILQRRVCP